MDFSTVVIVSALLLVVTAAEAEETELEQNIANITTSPNQTTGKGSSDGVHPKTTESSSSSNREPTHLLGFLTVQWTSKCDGHVIFYHHNTSSHICHSSETTVHSLSPKVCENRKGCKNHPSWYRGKDTSNGYHVSEDRVHQRSSCVVLKVQCTVETDKVTADVHGRQLQVYRAVTALLCCVLLAFLLIRFFRPTVKALQKRLSDRRQSRWIGPTQSHSVSYQRGKSAVKNNDREQRLSYPALERLTLSDSREPSSNRNSDYNL